MRYTWVGVLLVAALVTAGRPSVAGPVTALITPGVGIGPLTLGMRAMDVPRVLKKNATPKISGDRVVYDFPTLGYTAWATDNVVVKVRTRNGLHRTRSGVAPGSIWSDGMLAMCSGMALWDEISNGVEFTCPTIGISFEVKNGRITAISVMPARR